jgi:hypothetical protein
MEPRQPKPTPPRQPGLNLAVYSFAIILNVVLLIVMGGFRTALGSAWAKIMVMLSVLLVALIVLPDRRHPGSVAAKPGEPSTDEDVGPPAGDRQAPSSDGPGGGTLR